MAVERVIHLGNVAVFDIGEDPDERLAFEHLIHVLQTGIDLRKPDGRRRCHKAQRAYQELVDRLAMITNPSDDQRREMAIALARVQRLGVMLRKTRKTKPQANDSGPTPETVVQQERAMADVAASAKAEGMNAKRIRGDSLARLRAAGIINSEEQRAGRQIATIFEAITRGMSARAAGYERGSAGHTGERLSARLALLHRDRYRPWALAAQQRPLKEGGDLLVRGSALTLTLAVAVDGRSLKSAAASLHVGYERAKVAIKAALALYVVMTDRTQWLEDREAVQEADDSEAAALAQEIA